MDLGEIVINGVNWICLAQDRVWWQEHGNESSCPIRMQDIL
jgi:hypothetical protein